MKLHDDNNKHGNFEETVTVILPKQEMWRVQNLITYINSKMFQDLQLVFNTKRQSHLKEKLVPGVK